ncbi:MULTISPECIES: acyltransferase family protein [Nitrospirillum]|uniref:Peptidoglycan/LPS O-acetylase OafA/YrhL n=1 Tax=Nitrospirillum amazonense TaxID=28077 RepID=A0A560FXV5_9PROT|nr:acyltransferase [Nitrospirillum amazonense]MEC4590391.1 acyltransferase [Nitrospirillum amazonense]TWB26320.1 peptidoglycan/LPS O-acetylase OafA/YrhL [Nitrospirillum amazonense]
MTRRLVALDGLRGWAAITVSMYHGILQLSPAAHDSMMRPLQGEEGFYAVLSKLSLMLFNGNAAVVIFFVLSGKVLFDSLQRTENKPAVTALAFSVKRLIRLYPPLWVALAIYAGVFIAGTHLMPSVWSVYFTFKQLLINASLTQITMYGASWTLTAELLAIPVLLGTHFLHRAFGSGGVFLAVTLLLVLPGTALLAPIPYMSEHAFLFALGGLVSTDMGAQLGQGLRRVPAIFILALFLLWVMFFPYQHITVVICQGFLVFLLICKISHSTADDDKLVAFLSSRISQYFGEISFSFYLLNPLSLEIVERTLYYFLPTYKEHYIEFGLLVGLLATLMTLMPAAWLYRFIEVPTINIGRTITGRMQGRQQALERFVS